MSNTPPYFTVEDDGPIARITFSHPKKHNALAGEKLTALTDTFHQLAQQKHVRVVVLQAQPHQHFCAGAEIHWLQTHSQNATLAQQAAHCLHHFFHALYHLPQPTIALAQGANFGGGMGLLACCDIVIAASNAQFCLSETRLGLIPATIAPYLTQAVGHRQAQYWSLTATPFDANAALKAGLIQAITPAPTLHQHGDAYAKQISAQAPQATQRAKQLFQGCATTALCPDWQKTCTQQFSTQLHTQEARNGITAFLDKRPPDWV